MDIQKPVDNSLLPLIRNIRQLEFATGCFICSLCSHHFDTDDQPARFSDAYSVTNAITSDPEKFQVHLTEYHNSEENLLCVYCNRSVSTLHIITHITQHLLAGSSTVEQQTYHCPYECCLFQFNVRQIPNLKLHWKTQHSNSIDGTSGIRCKHCQRVFLDLASWLGHIKEYSHSLTHCFVPGCFVKSPSRQLIQDHATKKHYNFLSLDKNLLALFKETIEVTCSRSEVTSNTSSSTEKSISNYNVNNIGIRTELSPPFVFLLRCPYCDLVTIRWDRFLMHPTTCCGVRNHQYRFSKLTTTQNGKGIFYRCHVYWCSKCQVVSTEQHLVAEHAAYMHYPRATVCKEHLRISLLDTSAEPITMDLSVKHDGHLETKHNPNISLISDDSVNEETESIMNLAALARPSASRMLCAASNTSQSTSTLSVISTSSVVTASNIPILTNSVSLNTFENFSAGNDTNSFTASEAASAVAAMAAAALSGLTNFNMTNVNSGYSFATTLSNPIVVTATTPSVLNVTSSSNSSNYTNHQNNSNTGNSPMINCSQETLDSEDKLSSDADVLQPDDGRGVSEGMVSFPFDETKFRDELSPSLRPEVLDILAAKMQQFSSYFVRILGKENHRRIPVCPECDKVFPYGLGDFKRHLLTVHLEVPREHLKDCLRFTYLPKSEEKFQEVQEQLAMRQLKPRYLEPGRRRIPLPYSMNVLRRLTAHLTVATREFLEQKMQLYSRLSVVVDVRGGYRRYKCYHCSYSSPHALADVRKHILGSHCGISTKHFRHCLQASRLDPIEFTLFSDEKLARLAKDFMHRRQAADANIISTLKNSPNIDDNSVVKGEPLFPTNVNSTSPSTTASSSVNNTAINNENDKYQDGYVSRFTAVVPGFKNKVTVRIRPPVPPDTNAMDAQNIAKQSNGSLSSNQITSSASPTVSCNMAINSSVDLTSLPPVPGIEGADSVVDLSLPFSEPVLRQLLEASGATEQHIEDVVGKMFVYSTYKMSRICRNDRTIAFRCPCGRLFITTRQPDSKIRAATLADSRRHVMGVHARIPNVFITICCQASRITREYDFQIYPDDMLLRLAMDRPIKLTNLSVSTPSACVNGNGGSRSSTSFTNRPLKELAPYPAQSLGQNQNSPSPHAHMSDNCEGDSLSEGDTCCQNNSFSQDDGTLKLNTNGEEQLSPDDKDFDTLKFVREAEDPLSNLRAAQASGTEEVERIIDLPYSAEALQNLVQGYCPTNYFPILQSKMDVYSSLKVYITRRRGRRYFCCSGCPSASPHGMGDIRKHILGVHAKVPERYKAAAMHCSRLSREDNTLLPNHVLLHLAKMKWKGTVIKPLSEMDLSQFGARRASAVGLTRPSGQFASQVYQPTTHLENTDKRAILNRTDQFTMNPPIDNQNLSQQPSKYPSPKPDSYKYSNSDNVSCNSKDGSSDGNFYILRKRHGRNKYTTSTTNVNGIYVYTCSHCQYTSGYIGAMRTHIVRVHMGLSAQKCTYCDATFEMHKDLVDHHEQSHPEFTVFNEQYSNDYQEAMSMIPVRDSDPLDSNTNKANNQSNIDQVFSTDYVDDDQTDESNQSTCLSSIIMQDKCSVTFTNDETRLAKIPRLDDDYRNPILSSVKTDFTINNPVNNNLEEDDDQFDDNFMNYSSSTNGMDYTTKSRCSPVHEFSNNYTDQNNLIVPGVKNHLSIKRGSSRRKPNKFQLVQLRQDCGHQTATFASSPPNASTPPALSSSDHSITKVGTPTETNTESDFSTKNNPMNHLVNIQPILGTIQNRINV